MSTLSVTDGLGMGSSAEKSSCSRVTVCSVPIVLTNHRGTEG